MNARPMNAALADHPMLTNAKVFYDIGEDAYWLVIGGWRLLLPRDLTGPINDLVLPPADMKAQP